MSKALGFASIYVELAASDASYTTGSIYGADGGLPQESSLERHNGMLTESVKLNEYRQFGSGPVSVSVVRR